MKKATLLLTVFVVLCVATSQAVVIYENPSGGAANGWNWGTTICTHTAAEVDLGDGNMVIRHTGVVSNTTGAAADARFGSKWDITVSGNTSADPADYTISFDVRNVSGNWDPYPLGVSVLTKQSPDAGHSFPTINVAQADGWVHVEFNLADYTGDWWEASEWDLTNPNWSLEVGGPGWPGTSFPNGTSFTQIWEMDYLKITMGSDAEPHDPVVLPDNGDGTVGTLISQSQAQVTLGWMAGGDPNIVTDYPVNPAILGHYVYLSSDEDEEPQLLDYVPQVHDEVDPYLTDPYNEYGPVTVSQSMTYFWSIEEALDNGTGNPYAAGDPNNIFGPVWSFTAVAATPQILAGPEHALADFDGNASFTVTTGVVATDFRWFRVGDPDIQLADGGLYTGTQTKTLVISGATVADEGEYYCIAYNGDPDNGGIPSLPSKTARLWYPRLVSHYPFETAANDVTPDLVSGYDAVLTRTGPGLLPQLNNTDAVVGTSCLELVNPDSSDPNGMFGQIPAGVVAYRDITISLWVRPTSIFGWSRILDFGSGTNDYLFLTADAGWGVMRFAIRTPSVEEQLLEAAALTAGEWYHVAVTITGNTGRLYRNGELVATNTNMTINPIDVNALANYLGKSQWPDPEFNGLIDDLKIYNYALSTVDVAQEFLAIAGGSVCNREIYNMQAYDTNGNCRIDLPDFVSFAERWLEDQRIYPQ